MSFYLLISFIWVVVLTLKFLTGSFSGSNEMDNLFASGCWWPGAEDPIKTVVLWMLCTLHMLQYVGVAFVNRRAIMIENPWLGSKLVSPAQSCSRYHSLLLSDFRGNWIVCDKGDLRHRTIYHRNGNDNQGLGLKRCNSTASLLYLTRCHGLHSKIYTYIWYFCWGVGLADFTHIFQGCFTDTGAIRHWGNHMIAPVPVKQPWMIWVNIWPWIR